MLEHAGIYGYIDWNICKNFSPSTSFCLSWKVHCHCLMQVFIVWWILLYWFILFSSVKLAWSIMIALYIFWDFISYHSFDANPVIICLMMLLIHHRYLMPYQPLLALGNLCVQIIIFTACEALLWLVICFYHNPIVIISVPLNYFIKWPLHFFFNVFWNSGWETLTCNMLFNKSYDCYITVEQLLGDPWLKLIKTLSCLIVVIDDQFLPLRKRSELSMSSMFRSLEIKPCFLSVFQEVSKMI